MGRARGWSDGWAKWRSGVARRSVGADGARDAGEEEGPPCKRGEPGGELGSKQKIDGFWEIRIVVCVMKAPESAGLRQSQTGQRL